MAEQTPSPQDSAKPLGEPGPERGAGPRQATPIEAAPSAWAYGVQGPPPPTCPPGWMPPSPRKPRTWVAVLLGILLAGSALLNLLLVIAVGATLGVRGRGEYRTQVLKEGAADEVIAVVPVYSIIDDHMAAWIEQLLRDLRKDGSVKAVVLNVDSPGGTVSASDQIHHALTQFKAQTGRKLVVAQGGMATSGGYYVSAAGDYVVAEPTTWTGNIGVIMTSFIVRKGLEDKLGVTPVVVGSSQAPFKDVPSLFRDMKPDERAYVQELVESAYERFVTIVKEGRKFDSDVAHELSNGKVYTAEQALANKLIDKIGYVEDAWNQAAKLAGLSRPKVVRYSPRLVGLADLLFAKASSVPALERMTGDPGLAIEGMLAPRLMYLYHGQTPADLGPRLRYPRPAP